MGKIVDVPIGKRFGSLVVDGYIGVRSGKARWLCSCDCGEQRVCEGSDLRNGQAVRCAKCSARENVRHGHSPWGKRPSPTYVTWASMLTRCLTPSSSAYPKYGARGVTVCERWRTFALFLADMGERPPGTSIDRIDNSKGYEPGNCRWATASEQMKNSSHNKLTDAQRNEICAARAAGVPTKEVASRYGINVSHVRRVMKSATPGALARSREG